MRSEKQHPERTTIVLVAGLTALLLVLASVSVSLAQTPSEPDPGAAAVGSSLFRSYCASCHGTSGVGDGQVAEFLKVKPADLTGIAERRGGKFDFDLVVRIIDGREKVQGHGHGEMPVWGDAFKIAGGGATAEEAHEKIEQLAHYLWTIQR